jgi:hypothetical protein
MFFDPAPHAACELGLISGTATLFPSRNRHPIKLAALEQGPKEASLATDGSGIYRDVLEPGAESAYTVLLTTTTQDPIDVDLDLVVDYFFVSPASTQTAERRFKHFVKRALQQPRTSQVTAVYEIPGILGALEGSISPADVSESGFFEPSPPSRIQELLTVSVGTVSSSSITVPR